MTNLYHRELLPRCPTAYIEALLDEALAWTAAQGGKLSKPLSTALKDRLSFRRFFLQALNDDYVVDLKEEELSPWEACARLLPKLSSSHGVGERVPGAFSIKIQRRLASTVPPRPIVNISFKDAHDYLCKLSKDGHEAKSVLRCQTGRELQVCHPHPSDRTLPSNLR